MVAPSPTPRGAYGLRLSGIAPTRLPAVDFDWPSLRLERRLAEAPPPARELGEDAAVLPYLHGGWAALDRRARTAIVHTRRPLGDEELLHPYLAAVAATFARWDGREALHGGAVVGRDGAWAVLAARGAGKSTAVAALGRAGRPIVADDLVVVEDGRALAGPSCVDLRPDAATLLGLEDAVTDVRAGERGRLAVPPAPPSVPLAGLVFLTWGPRVALTALGPAARLARLAPCRAAGREDATADRALALTALPAWLLERPRDGDPAVTVEALDRLLDG